MSRGFHAWALAVLLVALPGTEARARSSRTWREIQSPRRAAAATTRQLLASAPSENNSAGKQALRSQPAPAAQTAPTGTQSIVAPKQGFTIVARGPVRRLTCKGKELKFLLMVNGSGVLLLSPDESKVRFVGVPASAAHRSPCSFLRGRRVRVHFLLVHGKPYFGKILEVDMRH
jgi:hypothetical protein